MQQMFLLQILLLAQQHLYAHQQELESIIQIVAACGISCFGFQVVDDARSKSLQILFQVIW